MKKWYYAENGERKGPVDFSVIQSLYQSGQIKADDLVWEEGMADWVKAGSVISSVAPSGETPSIPVYTGSASTPRPDYGDFLCWGIALVVIPCLGYLALIALIVLHILELVAVRKEVEEGKIQPGTYTNIHPVLMGLGLFCCALIFYPLFMHFRNESKLFKPQPHAVWFSIVIMVLLIIVSVAFQLLSLLGNSMQSLGH